MFGETLWEQPLLLPKKVFIISENEKIKWLKSFLPVF